MGITPHQHLIPSWVNHPKKLLLTNEYFITQISCTVGFANQSHLHLHFRKFFGITPGKISKQSSRYTAI